MTWESIGRFAVRAVATGTVGQVVNNVVKATLPENAGRIAKASAQIGGFIISSMVGDAAADYAAEQVDKLLHRRGGDDA